MKTFLVPKISYQTRSLLFVFLGKIGVWLPGKKKKKTFYSPCLRKQPSRNITGSLCCQKKIWSWDFSTISKNILIYLEPGLSQHDSFKHLITKLLFRFLKAVAICNFHSFQKMKDSPYVGYVMIDSRVTFLQFVTRMTTFSRHCSL